MATFHLQIVTPEGLKFDDEVENIIIRTNNGDVGILKGHIGYVSAVDAGKVRVKQNGTYKVGAASGGFIRAGKDETTLVVTTFEWADEIDTERAQKAFDKSMNIINNSSGDGRALKLAKFKNKKAKVRLSVAANA